MKIKCPILFTQDDVIKNSMFCFDKYYENANFSHQDTSKELNIFLEKTSSFLNIINNVRCGLESLFKDTENSFFVTKKQKEDVSKYIENIKKTKVKKVNLLNRK